jgi:hypothetical protein
MFPRGDPTGEPPGADDGKGICPAAGALSVPSTRVLLANLNESSLLDFHCQLIEDLSLLAVPGQVQVECDSHQIWISQIR